MSQQLYAEVDGWSHDCRFVWYFSDLERRPDGRVGDEVTLNLTNVRPDGSCEGKPKYLEIEGVIIDREPCNNNGYFLQCRIKHEEEIYIANMAMMNFPNPCDSVKFVRAS